MPWRETSDPYAIWVSEVMLQQTRVDTVIPYWERWLERFPTVGALAEADIDDVLKHWEGLGYYSRARNLHRAAGVVRERYEGAVPADADELRTLPGVGEYTAGAVASIAFGATEPAVDGNVRRVLSRLHDLEAPTARQLRGRAAELVPEDRPGEFNQALMELGATICTPRDPDCAACPVSAWCEARRLGVQEQRPLPRTRKPVPHEVVRTVVLVREDGPLLMARRPPEGLLAGLWEFPGEPLPPAVANLAARRDPQRRDRERRDPEPLESVTHTFSHRRITYDPVLIRVAVLTGPHTPRETDDIRWVPPSRLHEYALPVAQQKIARLALGHLRGGTVSA